ncbi:ABC transporter permease [Streptococcus pacificus]|uniref:ABC transporter permease n=1 Tax=Streptococcus pacificus TaxID=2740577 RepID=A0ABS0ZJQ5_9STRE|nr:ABC transporter permease [Streptococcus pacificus]MBJ8326239.1 ABC transporter permease [Streptococcus pacificus]
MRLFHTFIKEMKLAARGFYFYIEIIVAVIALIVLMTLVKEQPSTTTKEFIFLDVNTSQIFDNFNKNTQEEKSHLFNVIDISLKPVDDSEMVLKPSEFTLIDDKTGSEQHYSFSDEKKVNVKTFEKYNPKTKASYGFIYLIDNKDDFIRLIQEKGNMGLILSLDGSGKPQFKYFLQGYEPTQLKDLLYLLHSGESQVIPSSQATNKMKRLKTENTLNQRELMMPPLVTILGSLMGFFVMVSYIFLDKEQGAIKAFAVSPGSMKTYLFTKIMVAMTSTLISTSIIVIPIMKARPDYLLFYPLLIASAFAFCSLGLLVASFFNQLNKAFSVLYLIMLILMLPILSYYITTFNPTWIRILPTHFLLQDFKAILSGTADTSFTTLSIGLSILSGMVLLILSDIRFKKTLTV